MGILTFIKSFIRDLVPLGLYGSTLGACLLSAAGRPFIAVLAIAAMTPLPNVWYQIHQFPFGKDVLDLLTICGLIGIVVGRHRLSGSRAGLFLLTYLLFTYVAVWNSSTRFGLPAPVSTANPVFVVWKNYAQMVLLYILAFHALNDEKHRRWVVWTCMVVLFIIVLREGRNFSESTSFSYDKRAAGPFWVAGLGPNHFGAFVVHFAVFGLGLAFFAEKKYQRWFLWGTAFFSLPAIFFSYSRGAYLAALAVLALYGLLKKRVLLAVLAALLVSWQTLLPHTVVERINMTETADGQLESSAADRVVLWDSALSLFESSPLVGVGLGGFGLSQVGGQYTSVHNLYLETLAEQGILGLGFLIAVMLRALFCGARLAIRGRTSFERGVGFGFAGAVIAMIITNMFGDRWSYFAIGAHFWILWGIVDRYSTALEAVPAQKRVPVPARERPAVTLAANAEPHRKA